MRSQDILKLASIERFKIFVINPRPEESYTLKGMSLENELPSWNILASNVSYDEAVSIIQGYKLEGFLPLLCSDKFNSFDLKEISDEGFIIWKESNDDKYYIEQYMPDEFKWKRLESFEHLQERIAFINHQLMNPNLIIVD